MSSRLRFLRPRGLRLAAALGVLAALPMLVFLSGPAIGDEPACAHGTEQKTVVVGIVKAIGCWTQSTNGSGDTIYTAPFDVQDKGVDLNGFVVSGDKGNGLQINATTRVVTSIKVSTGAQDYGQLYSRNWPTQGQISPVGSKTLFNFQAPMNSPLELEQVHFSSSDLGPILSGLSLVGDVETPVMLEPDGDGSMDLTVRLAGIFTLKGKPQSATIALPTKSEEGTKLDGFELKLKEIDSIRAVTLYDLDARYSAEKKVISGSVNLGFPFFAKGVGVGAGFTLQNGVLTDLSASVHGTHIPIGGAGFITDLGGGFHFAGVVVADFNGYCKSIGYESAVIIGGDTGKDAYTHWKCHKGSTNDGVAVDKACQWQTGNPSASARYSDPNDAHSWQCVGASPSTATSYDLSANAKLGANFGPEIPSPFGNIPPLRADASLDVGYVGEQLLVAIHGGVQIFRLPVGDVYLTIHSNSGVEFGAGLGIGFPSYTNNESDPFYIGARVEGWVAKGKFQFEGKGRVALAGIKIFDGKVLVNDRASGACWTVLGVPGGAVYVYGRGKVDTFGIGCGLDDYKEQFPGGAVATAARAQTFKLNTLQHTLAVRGAGAAPRFTLRSADGRIIRVPTSGSARMTHDYFVYVNQGTRSTYVVLRHATGTWTITPYQGSATITSVKAGRIAPPEHVTAKVLGTGTTRTLVFHSLNRPHTRLQFVEVLPNGTQFPILNTDAANGRYRFRLQTGSGYGLRRIRVAVIHGFGSRQSGVVARYRLNPPRSLPAPQFVSAGRDGFTAYADWARVNGAGGYLVQFSLRHHGRLVVSFLRQVSARAQSIRLPSYPGTAGKSVATVWALNSDGKLGRGRSFSFKTSPSALTLKAAARLSVRSAYRRAGAVFVNTQCPAMQGHCQVRLQLLLNGRVIVKSDYQQTPGTFLLTRLLPSKRSARRALAQALRSGRGRVRVAVRIFRFDRPGAGLANATA